MVVKEIEADVPQTVTEKMVYCDACLDECTHDWKAVDDLLFCPECYERLNNADEALLTVGDTDEPETASLGYRIAAFLGNAALVWLVVVFAFVALSALLTGETATFVAAVVTAYIFYRFSPL